MEKQGTGCHEPTLMLADKEKSVSPPFNDIRKFCGGRATFDRPVDARPQAVAAHRQAHWPDIVGVT